MDTDAIDKEISTALDSGFLPPDPEALEATIRVLYAETGIVPVPTREDSVDGRLLQVGMSFHSLVAAILADEVVGPVPGGGGVILAGVHVQSVAALLTLLNLRSSAEVDDRGQNDEAPHAQALQEGWLNTIVNVCRSEHEPPWHLTPAAYVAMAASTLSQTTQTLRDEPQILLDPHDPRIRVRPEIALAHEKTSEKAGVELVWFAAAALCIAACCSPGFRLGRASKAPPANNG